MKPRPPHSRISNDGRPSTAGRRGNPCSKAAVRPANGRINPSLLTRQPTLASPPYQPGNQPFNGYIKPAGRVDFDAGPAPAPAGISPRGCRLRYDKITQPRAREDQPWHRRKPLISMGIPRTRGNHRSRPSLLRNGRFSAPGAARHRISENRRPVSPRPRGSTLSAASQEFTKRRSPTPAGINRAGSTTTFTPGAFPHARGNRPITDDMPVKTPVMFPRQRASTSLIPVSDQQAAPSHLTAGITTQEKFQRAPARFHHPVPAGIRPRKNRPSNVKTAAPRRPGNGPAQYAKPRQAWHLNMRRPPRVGRPQPHSMPSPAKPGIRPGAPQESTPTHDRPIPPAGTLPIDTEINRPNRNRSHVTLHEGINPP